MKLYIVGIPIDNLNDDFLRFINSKQSTVLLTASTFSDNFKQSNEYRCAPIGFNKLLESYEVLSKEVPLKIEKNYLVFLDLWRSINVNSKNGRRQPSEVINDLIYVINNIVEQTDVERIGIIYTGNPLYHVKDIERLIDRYKDVEIIQSESSMDLALKELSKYENVKNIQHYDHNYDIGINIDLYDDKINVYSCLGIYYGVNIDLFLSKLTDDYKSYLFKFGEQTEMETFDGELLKYNLSLPEFREYIMDRIILVMHKDLTK